MAHLENKILNDTNKPPIYVRYIDDIFILAKIIDQITQLKNRFEKSVLKFTLEIRINNKIPFFDVLIDSSTHKFTTSLYRKPISINLCLLSYNSECPQ